MVSSSHSELARSFQNYLPPTAYRRLIQMPVIGLLTVDLHVYGAQSLKDKRMTLRAIRDRLKKFNVAVAETDFQDLWQRARFGVVTVSNSREVVDQALAAVVDEIERVEPGLITHTEVEILT